MDMLLCGRPIAAWRGTASPFAKIIALGFDDGPSTGVVLCQGCSGAYRFELIAIDVDGTFDHAAWDRGEELRVFSLAPLPEGSFDRIVAALAAIEAPRWPTWAPGVDLRAPELDRLIESDIASILHGADRPTLVVVAAGLLQPFVTIRESPEPNGRTPTDWFALFGFVADKQLVTTP